MRLVTYYHEGESRAGAIVADYVIDLNRAYKAMLCRQSRSDELAVADARMPTEMKRLLEAGDATMEACRQTHAYIEPRLTDEAETLRKEGLAYLSNQTQLLAPVLRPGKVICLGLNYKAHADESGFDYPAYPVLFHKAASSVVGAGEAIILPSGANQVDYEAELSVVIGRRGKYISEENALEYVAGYACANDVSEREWQFRTPQWTAGKMIDTFCPLGPALVTRDEVPDPNALDIRLILNGEVLQDANTADMIFNVPFTISYISRICALEPGDVILTGTPQGIGSTRKPQIFLKHGDTVTVEIERLGALTNPVRNEVVG